MKTNTEQALNGHFTINDREIPMQLAYAAPELLGALKELAFTVETIAHLQGLERDLLPMADKARAAIAKATGGVKC
jgi:hypothetical protein